MAGCEIDALKMEPYRVEWRADLVTGWVRLQDFASRDKAAARATKAANDMGGQARVVTQHVIGVAGLNATEVA